MAGKTACPRPGPACIGPPALVTCCMVGTRAENAEWSPTSWKARPAAQQPVYRSEAEVAEVVSQISKLPPLVTSWEIGALQKQLAEAARGERFLLQGGDCAESFDHCDPNTIADKLKILLQPSDPRVQRKRPNGEPRGLGLACPQRVGGCRKVTCSCPNTASRI